MRPQLGLRPYMAVFTKSRIGYRPGSSPRIFVAAGPAHAQPHDLGGSLAVGHHHERQTQEKKTQCCAYVSDPVGRQTHA